MGCYIDKGRRDLPKRLDTNGRIKARACFNAAKKRGFKFVGLQYGGECWAGNKPGKYGKRSNGECNMNCKSNGQRKCGGTWRNMIYDLRKAYRSVAGEKPVGCFVDKGKRDLPRYLGTMAPATCFRKAKKTGCRFVGLQYGGQCFVGDRGGKYGKRPMRECNMTCRSDKSRKCGGTWRNMIFKFR